MPAPSFKGVHDRLTKYEARLQPLGPPPDCSEFAHHLSAEMSRSILLAAPYALARRLGGSRGTFGTFCLLTASASALPLVLAFATGYRGLELVWLTEWGVVDALLLIVALAVASRAIRVATAVTGLVESNRSVIRTRGDAWWRTWNDRWMRRKPQLIAWLAGLFAAALAAIPVADALHSRLQLGLISYIQLAVTGGLGAGLGYFGVAAIDLCRHLAHLNRSHRFSMVWWAPARTPAIQELSKLYRFAGFWAFMGALLFSPPVVWAYLSGTGGSTLLIAVIVAITGTLVLLVSVGWMPHYWLSRIVRHEKRITLEALTRRIEDLPAPGDGATWSAADLRHLPTVAIAMAMEAADGVTYDLRYLLRVSAAITLSVLPYIVSLIIHL